MKIQDMIFIVLFGVLLFLKKPRYCVVAGLMSLIVAMPLFTTWVFFTAQRLVWYAALCFFLAFLFSMRRDDRVQ